MADRARKWAAFPNTAANASAVDGKGVISPAPDDKPAVGTLGTMRIQTKPNKKDKKGKKMKGIKMTKTGALMVERQVQMNLIKHNLAAKCFLCRQFWFFTVPQAILTMISNILAFVATTDLINERTKIILNTIVGSTSGIVVFLQTMSGICDYGTRGAMHNGAAIDLGDLRDDLVLSGFKLGLTEVHREKTNLAGEEEDKNSSAKKKRITMSSALALIRSKTISSRFFLDASQMFPWS